MIFEILYILACIRGFIDIHDTKSNIFMAEKDKILIKELYISLKCIPYKIGIDGVDLILGNNKKTTK